MNNNESEVNMLSKTIMIFIIKQKPFHTNVYNVAE